MHHLQLAVIDGVDNTSAVAGPWDTRAGGGLPITGLITVDIADFPRFTAAQWLTVFKHEMVGMSTITIAHHLYAMHTHNSTAAACSPTTQTSSLQQDSKHIAAQNSVWWWREIQVAGGESRGAKWCARTL